MALIRQKTAFGPGVYRGHKFTAERLRRFVDSSNKAIEAGIPIPLLQLHAPLNANDEQTSQFAAKQGAGWIKRYTVEEDGCLGWEAEAPDDVKADVDSGRVRYTSPEFRESYVSEKAGAFEGPIIRHMAFTPLPGNPHQGPIETANPDGASVPPGVDTLALEENSLVGAFQFAEEERQPLTDEEDTQHAEVGGDMKSVLSGLLKQHGGSHDAATGKMSLPADKVDAFSKAATAAGLQHGAHYAMNKTKLVQQTGPSRAKAPGPQFNEGTTVTKTATQHAEKKPKDDEAGNAPAGAPIPEAVDDPAAIDILPAVAPEAAMGAGGPMVGDPAAAAMMGAVDPMMNPDMPPVATDRTKLAAVLAGLNQKGVVLPSDFDFANPGALDIILAALNSNIKAEQDAEMEAAAANQQESLPAVTESSMPFSEADYQFSEDELAAMPEKTRKVLEAGRKALQAEREARIASEQEALRFAEEQRVLKNETARKEAINTVKSSGIPVGLKNQLLAAYGEGEGAVAIVQFNEGLAAPVYTPAEVAQIVAASIPPFLLQLGEQPITTNNNQTEENNGQFWEAGLGKLTHTTPERAEQLVAAGPVGRYNANGRHQVMKTISDTVAEDFRNHPNQPNKL